VFQDAQVARVDQRNKRSRVTVRVRGEFGVKVRVRDEFGVEDRVREEFKVEAMGGVDSMVRGGGCSG
jgi:hypothetical protein